MGVDETRVRCHHHHMWRDWVGEGEVLLCCLSVCVCVCICATWTGEGGQRNCGGQAKGHRVVVDVVDM